MQTANARLSPSLPPWATKARFRTTCRKVADRIRSFYKFDTLARNDWHLDFPDHAIRMRELDCTLEVKPLGEQGFTINRKTKIIHFNEDALFRVYETILSDLNIPETERLFIADSGIALYMLHELRHVSQELELYSSIQDLKAIGQTELIAHFDTLADIAASKDLATFMTWEKSELEYASWADQFLGAMYIQIHYCITSFDFYCSRNWKMGRAIGLTLVLARASIIMESNLTFKLSRRSLSTGILVKPSTDYTTASILWLDTQLALAAVVQNTDRPWLLDMALCIEAGDMTKSLEIAAEYLLSEPAFWHTSNS